MRRFVLLTALLVATSGWASPPDFAEVPMGLRTDPQGVPLDDKQRAELGARKILSEVVKESGPEPWPGVAVAIVDAPPDRVFALLRDYAHFPDFMPYISRANVDEHVGNRRLVSYSVRGPAGIGNRDYQLEVFDEKETQDGVTFLVSRFHYTGRGNIVSMKGTWKLLPIWSGSATLVRYEVRTDLGGGFTTWIKRKIASAGLPRIISAVRKRLGSQGR